MYASNISHRAYHPRKLTRCTDRRCGGGHRARGIQDNKIPTRREQPDAILEDFSKSSSIVSINDEDVKHNNDSSGRIEKSSTATIVSKKSGQGAASGDKNSNGAKPRATAGSWFASQEERDNEGEGKKNDDVGDDDDNSSGDSFSDNIVNSKRCYRGEGKGTLEGGSPGEGRGEDGTGGGGSVGSSSGVCWGESYNGGQTPARCNSLMLSYERGHDSDLVQCVIVRNVSKLGTIQVGVEMAFSLVKCVSSLGSGEQVT